MTYAMYNGAPISAAGCRSQHAHATSSSAWPRYIGLRDTPCSPVVTNVRDDAGRSGFTVVPARPNASFGKRFPNSPMNAWLQYDFAATPRDIVEIKVTFPPSGGIFSNVNMAPKNFSLYYSDDGLTWVRQRAWSEQSFSFGETKTYDATPLSSILIKNRLVLERNLKEIESALGPDIICTTLRGPNFSRAKNNTAPLRCTPYTGTKRIAGSTTSLGVPLARRVDLLDQKSGQLVARINTPSTGEFEFSDLADGFYSLIGVDNTAEQNSVIFAHVAAVP